jgi:hypothetical protein
MGLFLTLLLSAGLGFSLRAEDRVMSVSVDDPRPVAQAMRTLESLYGWTITYEDPRYVHISELADVTYRVRRDLAEFPIGRAPKVLVPRGGPLTVNYSVSSASGMPDTAAALIQKVLDVHAAGGGSSFRLLQSQSGRYFHVVPAQVKNGLGQLVGQSSILDTVINLSSEERNGREMLEAICNAIGEATQRHVLLGTIPEKLFYRDRVTKTAFNEIARDVLTKTLSGTGVRLSWQLLYDPGLEEYVLNIHPVFTRKQTAADAPRLSAP